MYIVYIYYLYCRFVLNIYIYTYIYTVYHSTIRTKKVRFLGLITEVFRERRGASHNYSYAHNYSYRGDQVFLTTYSTGMVNIFLSIETQTICLTLDECIFSKSSWTTPFLAGQLHPSFDFCLVRGSILFCTFRRNDTFVLRENKTNVLTAMISTSASEALIVSST